ncbi:hypothetical protein DFJ74DRAFT_713763 [Hyaloraphidium curvatum]|nr:hypothetical protein DFJ74DRAFT_713763 [Hyaloraphidium curvatum]
MISRQALPLAGLTAAALAVFVFVAWLGGLGGRGEGGEPTAAAACDFDYAGPLRGADVDCFGALFGDAPFAPPRLRGGRTFSLRGVAGNGSEPPVLLAVLFRDRASVLAAALRSYWRHLRTPYELAIFDDNSSFPAAVRFLDRLRDAGVHVHRNSRPWASFDALIEMVADWIAERVAALGSRHYVLTDPDCALDSAPGNLLEVYAHALDALKLDAVGGSIRWDDLDPVVLGDLAYRYEDGVSLSPAKAFNISVRNYYYIEWMTDTTFTMRRAGMRMKRFEGKHARMLPPLGVRHLDFYLAKDNLPEDYVHYHAMARAREVNHMAHLD